MIHWSWQVLEADETHETESVRLIVSSKYSLDSNANWTNWKSNGMETITNQPNRTVNRQPARLPSFPTVQIGNLIESKQISVKNVTSSWNYGYKSFGIQNL